MNVTLTHRGEAFASAETEIEITDAGDHRDPDRDRADDRTEPPAETDGETDEDDGSVPIEGDVDDVPGFGLAITLVSLLVALALALGRSRERGF